MKIDERNTLADYAARLIGVALNQTASGRWVHPLRGVATIGTRQSKITVEISGVPYSVIVTQLDEPGV